MRTETRYFYLQFAGISYSVYFKYLSVVLVPLIKYYIWAKVGCEESHSTGLHSCCGVRVGQLKCVFLQDRRDNYTTDAQSVSIA